MVFAIIIALNILLYNESSYKTHRMKLSPSVNVHLYGAMCNGFCGPNLIHLVVLS